MHLTALALLLGCHPSADVDTSDVPDTGDLATRSPREALFKVDVQCPGNILDEPKAPCFMSVRDGEGASVYDGPAGLELRGHSSLGYPKPQYSVELRDYNELPVWPGAVWSYLDDGSNPGSRWAEASFDDAAWSTGAAPLGYGGDGLATTLQPPPATGPVTTWFRRIVQVESAASVTRVKLGLIREDGAAVYLNGVEVLRDNLPVGASPSTPASSHSTPAESLAWVEVDVAPGLLHSGANTLAVEVHRADASTDQLRFDLYFEALGNQRSVNFGEMGANPDWIVDGLYTDRLLWRNRLAYDLFQSFGGRDRYAPESRFCELELNDEYQGVYSLDERIGLDVDRLDLPPSSEPGDTFIIKLDARYGFHPNAVGAGTWQMVYPEDDAAAAAAVASVLVGLEQAVHRRNPRSSEAGIFSYIDLESAVDFVLLQEFMLKDDGYDLDVHLWRGPAGKMHFTPSDFDLSMGTPKRDCGAEGWLSRPEYIEAMVGVPAFKDALVARWFELRQQQLSLARLLGRLEGYDATLAPGLERNLDKWPVDEITVTDVGEPTGLCPVATYEDEHARVLAYIAARVAWMDANIDSF